MKVTIKFDIELDKETEPGAANAYLGQASRAIETALVTAATRPRARAVEFVLVDEDDRPSGSCVVEFEHQKEWRTEGGAR